MNKTNNNDIIEIQEIELDSELEEQTIEINPLTYDKTCSEVVDVDCCFIGKDDVVFEVCQDNKEETVGPFKLKCQARLLKINVKLKDVCKGRKIAVGVIVCEDDKIIGFKGTEVLIPGRFGSGCRDIIIKNFCFVLPESEICDKRRIIVKVIAHYTELNSKFDCCC